MSEKNDKFILDATAGYRMMWYDKHHPNVLYIDQRPECEPDQVIDWTEPLPYPDNKFRFILFDPPHIIRKNPDNCDANILRRFGVLNADTWRSDLSKTIIELFRVLSNYGILLFKWNNQHVSSNELIKLFPVKPLVYQVAATSDKSSRNGRVREKVQTLWFCFMKIPKMET